MESLKTIPVGFVHTHRRMDNVLKVERRRVLLLKGKKEEGGLMILICCSLLQGSTLQPNIILIQ